MNITLTIEQTDALLEYLMTRPGNETFNAILWLHQAKAHAAAEASTETPTKPTSKEEA